MSTKYLGETFDIHTGGIDHIPVHHNNEIAQSEAASKAELAHYWLHNGFVNIQGEKMSKSLGNFTTIRGFLDSGVDPMVLRLFVLLGVLFVILAFTVIWTGRFVGLLSYDRAVLQGRAAGLGVLCVDGPLEPRVADVDGEKGHARHYAEPF